jgi:ABC-type lipoprotein release transport system permease subunit
MRIPLRRGRLLSAQDRAERPAVVATPLIVVAVAASALPAWRAARVDPVEALGAE